MNYSSTIFIGKKFSPSYIIRVAIHHFSVKNMISSHYIYTSLVLVPVISHASDNCGHISFCASGSCKCWTC